MTELSETSTPTPACEHLRFLVAFVVSYQNTNEAFAVVLSFLDRLFVVFLGRPFIRIVPEKANPPSTRSIEADVYGTKATFQSADQATKPQKNTSQP
jgi:hypothetical protein